MEGCQKTLIFQRACLLFWSIFSLPEGPQAAGYDGARGTRPVTFLLELLPPAQPLPGTSASPETETQTSSRCLNTRRLSSGPQTLPGETMAGRKGADKHITPRIVTPPPAPCSQTESQTSGSSWTATPSRAPGRAAALSAWPEHQLLPLPGLSGIPSLPRGDCY